MSVTKELEYSVNNQRMRAANDEHRIERNFHGTLQHGYRKMLKDVVEYCCIVLHMKFKLDIVIPYHQW